MLVPASMLPLLPAAERPQPNALRPRRNVDARLATSAELKAKKAKLFLAESIEEVRALGFKHLFLVPASEAEYGEHDLWLEAADRDRAVHVLFIHEPFTKPAKAQRNKLRDTALMITTVGRA